jgi:hypothetical protein
VNIQSHEEFPSQLLNRDTWSNESIEEILRTSFIFWQRGHTTQDGKDFMRMYHVQPDKLPHLAIVDPRTGANFFNYTVKALRILKVYSFLICLLCFYQGFIEPQELAVKLMEFADAHSLESVTNSTRNSLQDADVADDLPRKESSSRPAENPSSASSSSSSSSQKLQDPVKSEIREPKIDFGFIPDVANGKWWYLD